MPSEKDIIAILKKAEIDAINDAEKLGMHGNFSNIILSINVSESSFALNEIEENQDLDQDSADEEESHYNRYISDSELQEIQEDGSIFTSLDDLKLKEYRNRLNKKDEMSTKTNPIFLNVNLKNGKKVTVRKSSLCWFFSQKKVDYPLTEYFVSEARLKSTKKKN